MTKLRVEGQGIVFGTQHLYSQIKMEASGNAVTRYVTDASLAGGIRVLQVVSKLSILMLLEVRVANPVT